MLAALFSFFLLSLPQPARAKATAGGLPSTLLESRLSLCRRTPAQARGCASALRYLAETAGGPEKKGRDPASAPVNFIETEFARQKQRLAHAPIPETEWVRGAFNAWLAALDPHAKLVPAAETDRLASAERIPVQGAGAKLRFFQNKVFVSYAAEGSAAEAAGVREGDRLLSLNGVDLSSLSETARRRQLSRVKPPFRLLLERNGKARELTIEERRYTLANVEASTRSPGREKEGVLRVRSFDQDNTCSEMREALSGLAAAGVAHIRLDLTNNPGGLVRESQCAAGLFLGPAKPFARLRARESAEARALIPAILAGASLAGAAETELRTEESQATALPLVVVVNQNTASAAEMLAAALQDSGRALVEGTRSFGKGTMQSVFHPWGNEHLYLTRTTHAIYRISGTPLNQLGVMPDRVLGYAEGENFPREAELAP